MYRIINILNTTTFTKVILILILNPHITNAEDSFFNGQTPLHTAAYNGDKPSASSLINDFDINAEDWSGWTPLHVAAYRGHEDITRFLLEHDPDVNKADNIGQTPLYIAIYKGHYNIVNLLIQKRAKVDMVDDIGWAPLHLAAYQGHIGIARVLLIKYGTKVNKKTQDGRTSLDIALSRGHTSLAKFLKEKGAKENKMDENYQTSDYIIQQDDFIISQRDLIHNASIETLEPIQGSITIERYLEKELQFNREEIEYLKHQNPNAFNGSAYHRSISAINFLKFLKEKLQFDTEEIKELILQNPLVLTNVIYYQISLTMKELERSLQFSREEFRTLIRQNFSALVNTNAGRLRRIVSFTKGYVDKEEIKARLMQDPQALSEGQVQALRKVMPFINDYIEVDADKGTDGTSTWIPLHWLLFAKNVEQILPVIEGYGSGASLMAKHDNYRTPFQWAFFEDRHYFTAFFKGENIHLSECPGALSPN